MLAEGKITARISETVDLDGAGEILESFAAAALAAKP